MTRPDPVRVLHVTDPHLFADAEGCLRGTVTHSTLSAVIGHIVQSGWSADLIAMTGDLIHDDSAEAYDRFCELVAPLGLPVYAVPGNHDIRPAMRKALAMPPFHYCKSARQGNWLITGIDSCIDGDASGHVSGEELTRLEGVLSATDAEHVAVCLHHPPLEVGSKWLDQVGLRNREEFLDVVSRAGNVRATLFGHVHQQFDEEHHSIRIIGTPSTCAQFSPGSDDFAVDDNPPAYRRVILGPDGTVQTELIWL